MSVKREPLVTAQPNPVFGFDQHAARFVRVKNLRTISSHVNADVMISGTLGHCHRVTVLRVFGSLPFLFRSKINLTADLQRGCCRYSRQVRKRDSKLIAVSGHQQPPTIKSRRSPASMPIRRADVTRCPMVYPKDGNRDLR